MSKNREKGWLSNQIASASQSVDNWPSWMQKTARFEGSSRSTSGVADAQSPVRHTATKKRNG